MAQHLGRQSQWSALRLAGIALSALLAIGLTFPIVLLGWRDTGYTGMSVNAQTYALTAVASNSPAALAGLRAGDNILPLSLQPRERQWLFKHNNDVPPGAVLAFSVVRNGHERPVSLVAQRRPSQYGQTGRAILIAEYAVFVTYVVVGALLLHLRPGIMTAWLYLYCLVTAPETDLARAYNDLPEPVFAAFVLSVMTLVDGFTPVPLLPFVLRFPNDVHSGWRRKVAPAVSALVGFELVYWFLYEFRQYYDPAFHPQIVLAYDAPIFATYIIASVMLVVTYGESQGPDRQRIKYAVIGMVASFGAFTLAYADVSTSDASYVIVRSLFILSAVMPASIAYATLRHKLVDANFALNRALVFAVVTSTLIVSIGLIDWVLGNTLSSSHLTTAIEAGASIGLGLVLNKIYDRIASLVERILFRERHAAETYLDRVVRSLPFTTSVEVVDRALCEDAVTALRLASAGVFRRNQNAGSFVRVASVGWSADQAIELDPNDALVRFLEAELQPLDVSSALWESASFPRGTAAPGRAVPVVLRHELLAFVLYGGHQNATALDPVELALLDRLAAAAAGAYDQVDTLTLERTVAELRDRNRTLQALLAHAPPPQAQGAVLRPSVNASPTTPATAKPAP